MNYLTRYKVSTRNILFFMLFKLIIHKYIMDFWNHLIMQEREGGGGGGSEREN